MGANSLLRPPLCVASLRRKIYAALGCMGRGAGTTEHRWTSFSNCLPLRVEDGSKIHNLTHRTRIRAQTLSANVFIPYCGILLDELLHKPNALLVLEHLDGNSTGAEKFLFAHESPVLADDHPRNSV